jgi:hypothetical protein
VVSAVLGWGPAPALEHSKVCTLYDFGHLQFFIDHVVTYILVSYTLFLNDIPEGDVVIRLTFFPNLGGDLGGDLGGNLGGNLGGGDLGEI